MRDRDVRQELYRQVQSIHALEPDTRFIAELVLHRGAARIDLAVVNGKLHGYEIKSDADTLDRLPAQIEAYNAIFDEITVVIGVKHVAGAKELLPAWWGVTEAHVSIDKLELSVLRHPKLNPVQDSRAVAELLWRDEAIELLMRYSKVKGVSRLNRKSLTEKIDEVLDRETVCRYTRQALKSRVGWRVDEQLTICGGSFPLVSK